MYQCMVPWMQREGGKVGYTRWRGGGKRCGLCMLATAPAPAISLVGLGAATIVPSGTSP